VRIEADYSPHWSFACEAGEDCEFYNPAHDECNAVVWLENDDATNESLVAGFDAWTGPVKLKWNPDGDHVSGYYSFEVAALPVVSSPVTLTQIEELTQLRKGGAPVEPVPAPCPTNHTCMDNYDENGDITTILWSDESIDYAFCPDCGTSLSPPVGTQE
jgi:hypothetical protein